MSEHFVCRVRPSSDSLSELRKRASEFLRDLVPSEVGCDVLLALDETVSNAILHAGGVRMMVHVGYHDDRITATVRDGGPGFNVRRLVETWPPAGDAEGGRGIYLATRLMDSVAIHAACGTVVHMSRALVEDGDRCSPVCVWSSPALALFAHG